mmetsp:Transcript_3730/g.5781  ORF Transcript_3730/g.5781 Transcript_3730/m.5781 type:complete len:95 (+) Transcript_3730:168-452(+)
MYIAHINLKISSKRVSAWRFKASTDHSYYSSIHRCAGHNYTRAINTYQNMEHERLRHNQIFSSWTMTIQLNIHQMMYYLQEECFGTEFHRKYNS